MNKDKKIVILGASAKKERYSNRAVCELRSAGFDVVPVNPAGIEVDGITCITSLAELIENHIHTISLYINSSISDNIIDEVIRIRPHRLIFNPGTENIKLEKECIEAGIEVIHGCTLVMLRTGEF